METKTTSINLGEDTLEIEYYFLKEEKEDTHIKFPAEIEIFSIKYEGTEIFNLLTELDVISTIEEKILE